MFDFKRGEMTSPCHYCGVPRKDRKERCLHCEFTVVSKLLKASRLTIQQNQETFTMVKQLLRDNCNLLLNLRKSIPENISCITEIESVVTNVVNTLKPYDEMLNIQLEN